MSETNQPHGSENPKLSPAEFREKFRVSVGTLPNGRKIEVLSVKLTRDNWNTTPSGRDVRNYLCELYGRNVRFLYESYCSDNDVLIFEYQD